MSKIIKSSSANGGKSGKTIRIREISPFIHEKRSVANNTTANQSAEQHFHYKEQLEIVSNEKDELERLKKELEIQKDEWHKAMHEEKNRIQEESENLYRQTAEEGFNQGYLEGAEKAKAEYESYISEARQVVLNAKEDYCRKLAESEPVMLNFAINLAEKIISHTVGNDEAAWGNFIKEAVTEVREQEEVKIYVHPEWYEATLQHKKELEGIALHTRELLIFPDSSLEKMGCVIETPYGQIDASVDSQLREMKRILFEKLKEGAANEH
ncbi:flagellar assembly protein FliH [Salipaludibacillus sp. CUR1]|uniref:flagellar assembly protein FliH n=1 Tax=Salipaludibacillus sp. CUR1 TaxID=2820003 RepID=UPI001E2E2E8F|nr:flagellar assembly protein FliH [Salipaludibacillus sp. CUR1]MCE7794606.1 flagellar assembly protein FliH [Salipaludibacillus sp. CUR1]